MKKIFTWFLRKDLNLKNRWWHRLLSILFIISFLVFIFNQITSNYNEPLEVPQWKIVNTLSERITSTIKNIGDMVEIGEKIGEKNRTYVLNDVSDPYYEGILNDVYCSNELANDYEKVQKNRNAVDLYTGGSFSRNKVSAEEFSNYIKQYDVKCLVVDSFSSADFSKIVFLNTDKTYQDDWAFYEESISKSILFFIINFVAILIQSLLLFYIIAIIYYKIILYIIFGSKKNI